MPSPAQMAQVQVGFPFFWYSHVLGFTISLACNAGWHERPHGRHDEGDDGRTRYARHGGDAEYVILGFFRIQNLTSCRNDVTDGHGWWSPWLGRWCVWFGRCKSHGYVEDVQWRSIAILFYVVH